jgi:hypothetical protein
MIIVVAAMGSRSERRMFLGVAVDGVHMPPILRSDGVDVLGWKQPQAEDTKHRKACQQPPYDAGRHHQDIIGGGASPVKPKARA